MISKPASADVPIHVSGYQNSGAAAGLPDVTSGELVGDAPIPPDNRHVGRIQVKLTAHIPVRPAMTVSRSPPLEQPWLPRRPRRQPK
jgi:hypothetical protein